MKISILNAGQETDYLYGLVSGLSAIPSIEIEVVDSLSSIGVIDTFPNVKLFNLRGDNISPKPIPIKAWNILKYYFRLILYTVESRSDIFHIQWENSIAWFDRTVLVIFYKLCGKKLVFTAHNVYREARDEKANLYSRLSLYAMYHIVDCIIVHTTKMKDELSSLFHISPEKIAVIPHGINIRNLRTGLTKKDACLRLGIEQNAHVVLFFGQVDKYKGIETLIEAAALVGKKDPTAVFLIAGKPKKGITYAMDLQKYASKILNGNSIKFIFRFIPVNEVETYFAAADCLVLPYRRIFQSGVVFLAYRFGLPIIATDVGSLHEDIIDGTTGFICKPGNAADMAAKLQLFFASKLFLEREETRARIIELAERKYSWTDIAGKTYEVYTKIMGQ